MEIKTNNTAADIAQAIYDAMDESGLIHGTDTVRLTSDATLHGTARGWQIARSRGEEVEREFDLLCE